MTDINDFRLVLSSGTPFIVIETYEEKRVLEMMTGVAMKENLQLSYWSITEGIQRYGFGCSDQLPGKAEEPPEILAHIKENRKPGITVLCDYHPYLAEFPKHVRLLKDIALGYSKEKQVVVFISHALVLPPELLRYSSLFQIELPDDDQLLTLVREEASEWSKVNTGKRVKTDSKTLKCIVSNLQGLTIRDARRLVRGAIWDDGAISEDDLPEINKAKFELLNMDGVLSFEYDTERFSDVGGLDNFKRWLAERKDVFNNGGESTSGIDCPKGVLLLGVQGGGKSLAAKAVAGLWGIPLLRMDFGALYNKFIGETERNIRDALKMADRMSPCVLWLDEIEKGMTQDGADNGTSKRILGTVLTWMSERNAPVFIVATSNDISGLPPELIRKGRLDEIFFVDLPSQEVRCLIYKIHLKKRELDVTSFDLDKLAKASEGFTGAEIEQTIVSALYGAHARTDLMDTASIVREIEKTSPISVVMAEQIHELRCWAEGRTVIA